MNSYFNRTIQRHEIHQNHMQSLMLYSLFNSPKIKIHTQNSTFTPCSLLCAPLNPPLMLCVIYLSLNIYEIIKAYLSYPQTSMIYPKVCEIT